MEISVKGILVAVWNKKHLKHLKHLKRFVIFGGKQKCKKKYVVYFLDYRWKVEFSRSGRLVAV